MKNQLSKLTKVILWLNIISCFIFGIGYYFFPNQFAKLLNTQANDPVALQSIGGFLLAKLVGSGYALKTDN